MSQEGRDERSEDIPAPKPHHVLHIATTQDKYSVVAGLLQGRAGTLMDVGARDRVLGRMLDTNAINYFSSDLGPGHDYQFNIEEILPMPDRSIDIVVALDVLEHVEHIHQAFHELARLARHDLIVALPNMASLRRRWSFFWHGHLRTNKYDLLPEHQGDRHRWLTSYSQANTFIEQNATAAGFSLCRVIEELEGCPLLASAARYRLMKNGLMTGRCIYWLIRLKND